MGTIQWKQTVMELHYTDNVPFIANAHTTTLNMDLYLTTVHCRTNLCPIMEGSPLESSESGVDSLVLSLKCGMLLEDARSLPNKFKQKKRSRMETTSPSESLLSAIDELVMTLKTELLVQEKRSKTRTRDKMRDNRWSSGNNPSHRRSKGGEESRVTKDVSPKRPCRYMNCASHAAWIVTKRDYHVECQNTCSHEHWFRDEMARHIDNQYSDLQS